MKDKLKVAIMGSPDISKQAAHALTGKDIDVVIVNDNPEPDDDTFEINGVRYKPVESEVRKHKSNKKYLNSRMLGIMGLASMIYAPYMNDMYSGLGRSYQRQLPEGTDIVKEFGLIQQKKSKLSKWERDTVVHIFRRNFNVVEEK